MNVEQKLKSTKGIHKFFLVFGGILFIALATLLLIHLGFMEDSNGSAREVKPFLSRNDFWLLTAIVGPVGGIMVDFKHPLIAALSGLLAALAITGSGLLYFGWRSSIINVEVILPLLVGFIVGVGFANLLKRLFGAQTSTTEKPS